MKDVYQEITNQIVAKMETSGSNWLKPWNAAQGEHRNAFTNRSYNGINRFLLPFICAAKGYESTQWATYNQFKKAGHQIRKGEKATGIVLFKTVTKLDDAGEIEKHFAFAKMFSVFNSEQTDSFIAAPLDPRTPTEKIENAETYFKQTGSIVKHGGTQAFYTPSGDFIQMPEIDDFHESQGYYSTLAHEHVHWTGAKSRLDRDQSGRFGNQSYAFEELVAELGAAFCCQKLGIDSEPRDDHAKYLNNWLQVLKDDKRAIFKAASLAEKACTFMDELQPEQLTKAA